MVWRGLEVLAILVFFLGAGAGAADAWQENAANPIFGEGAGGPKSYYPAVVRDAANFSGHGAAAQYKMWYQTSSGTALATSNDGINWADAGLVLAGASHPLVEYYPAGFAGVNSGTNASSATMYYRMWYWPGLSYSVNDIRYADSPNGTDWYNDQPLQNGAVPIILNVAGAWNRGSYGPADVLHNPGASNSGTDWVFTMYYDGTTGGTESIGLGFSADGITWTGYDSNNDGAADPVLVGTGNAGDWDETYVSRATVLHNGPGDYEMFYSGGVGKMDHGIGYATSTDGITWTRDPANPIFHKTDGPAWRDYRTYTPSVIRHASGLDMWFTGRDLLNGDYSIGHAYVLGTPATVWVDDDWTSQTDVDAFDPGLIWQHNAFQTIRTGLAAVLDGGTVNVRAGTYSGTNLSLNKSVTLLGPNAGVHPAVGTHPTETVGARGPEATIACGNGPGQIGVSADDVTVDGFEITSTGTRIIDTYADADRFVFRNNVFTNTSGYAQQGVMQFGGGSHVNSTFEFNLLQGGETAMLYTGGDFTGLCIAYNRINWEGDAVFWTAAPLVDGVIQGNEFDGTIGGVPGVGFNTVNIGQAGNLQFVDNYIHDCQYTAIQVGVVGGTISGNLIEGMVSYSADPALYGGYGIYLFGGAWGTAQSTNVTISDNTIHFNSDPAGPVRGIRLAGPANPGDPSIDASTIHANYNNFINDYAYAGTHAIRHQGNPATTMDGENNWWGTGIEAEIAALMDGSVDYDPWLGGPIADVVVDDDWAGTPDGAAVLTQNGRDYYFGINAFATIQNGVDSLALPGIVHVQAGAYAESVTVDKRLTLTGAGNGDDPAVDTIVDPAQDNQPGVFLSGSGSGEFTRLTVERLRLTGATGLVGGNSSSGIEIENGTWTDHVTLADLVIVDNAGCGIAIDHTGTMEDLVVSGCDLSGNQGMGLSTPASLQSLDGLTVIGCNITNNVGIGLWVETANSTHITITDSTFSGNAADRATCADLILSPFSGDAAIANVQITSNNADSGIRISGPSTGSSPATTAAGPAGNIALSDIYIDGTQAMAGLAISRYTTGVGISMTNIELACIAPVGLHLGTMQGQLEIGSTSFSGTFADADLLLGTHRNSGSYLKATVNVDATAAVFSGAADDAAIENRVMHQHDDPTLGLVDWGDTRIGTTLDAEDVAGVTGGTVQLSATLTETVGGAPIPLATVAFTVDGNAAGTAVTDTNGVATLLYPVTEANGQYAVAATYAGDATWQAAADAAELTVTGHGSVTSLTVETLTPTVTADDTATFTATASDGTNTWDATAETVFSISAGAAGSWAGNVYTAALVGAWTVRGAYEGITATTGLTVTHGVAIGLAATPGMATVDEGAPQTYSATATDSDGNSWDVSTDPGTAWDDNGADGDFDVAGAGANVYTAGSAGTVTVEATYGGLTSNACTLTVNPVPAQAGNVLTWDAAKQQLVFGNTPVTADGWYTLADGTAQVYIDVTVSLGWTKGEIEQYDATGGSGDGDEVPVTAPNYIKFKQYSSYLAQESSVNGVRKLARYYECFNLTKVYDGGWSNKIGAWELLLSFEGPAQIDHYAQEFTP